jgi:hypothetical protein
MSSGPTPPQPRAPQAPPPPQPQPHKSRTLLWIFGIIGGGIALMIILALVVAGVFFRRIHVDESGNKVEIETLAGKIKVDAEGPRRTGLPIYPGATRSNTDGASIELSSKSGDAVGVAIEKYSTPDGVDKVTAWYAQKLGPNFHREDEHSRTHTHTYGGGNADVAFVEDRGAGARIVALSKTSAGAEITLVRAGVKEAQ